MAQIRSTFGNMSRREGGALVLQLLLAVIGVNVALSDEFAWYTRLGALVGFVGPFGAHVSYLLFTLLKR